MFKNKFDTVTNVFKAKSSTSAKTLRSGLFVSVNVGMAKAMYPFRGMVRIKKN